MPKGNHESNWPTNLRAPAEQKRAVIEASEKLRLLPAVDYKDVGELGKRIKFFFEFCIENEIVPGVELLSLSLGTNRKTIGRWRAEESERGKLIESAHQLCVAFVEQLGMQGKINPGVMIFMLKNIADYHDDVRITDTTTSTPLEGLPSKNAILKKISNSQIEDIDDDALFRELQ